LLRLRKHVHGYVWQRQCCCCVYLCICAPVYAVSVSIVCEGGKERRRQETGNIQRVLVRVRVLACECFNLGR